MKRTLLFIMALLVSASFSFAADPNNPDLLSQGFDDFWGSKATYDDATQTINYPDAWGSAVWTFWNNGDISAYQTLILEFEPVDFDVQPVIQYSGDGGEYKERFPGSAGKITINLTSASVDQIAIQNAEPGELTLIAAYLSKGGSGEPDCAVIMDFSDFPREDNNATTQPGWKAMADILDNVAAAKYFVIETEGVGDNAEGFGGLQFICQGGGDGVGFDWTQWQVIDDWVDFPRADGKTVSIAIDLRNVMGDKFDDFIQFTWWAQTFMGYYPGGGMTAIEGLGFKNVYLTGDFAKPADAVDLNGGTDWGFVFEGSVACGESGEPFGDIVFDFEGDEIDDTYPAVRFDGGLGDAIDAGEAIVVANPDPTEDNAQSLYYKITAYDQVISLGTVNLPQGYTLADCESISFDVYTEAGEYKELLIKIGDDPLWGNSQYKKISDGGAWGTNSVNLLTGVSTYADNADYPKSGSKGGTSVYTEENASLTSFELFVGINDNAIGYYLDNVILVAKNEETGIISIPIIAKSLVYAAADGIIVNADNEQVFIYGIDGRLVKQTLADNQFIPLERGLYIVKVGAAAAVKVLVK